MHAMLMEQQNELLHYVELPISKPNSKEVYAFTRPGDIVTQEFAKQLGAK